MTPVVLFLGWCMASLCFLLIASEMVDMVITIYRAATGTAAPPARSFGSFNMQMEESKLSERHDHTFRTNSIGMGGLNRFE